jgi:hypothetical protein
MSSQMLFFGYFSCLIVVFAVLAMWLVGLVNNSTLPNQHHPRPPIEQAVTAEEIAPLHLQVTKEASTAKDDVSPVKHHKREVLRQRNNNYGYWNAEGYGDAYRNRPQRLWSNW